MKCALLGTCLLAVAALVPSVSHAATAISGVTVMPAFFTPSIDQKETISFVLARGGNVAVSIVDRDGFVVRRLPPRAEGPGPVTVQFDGKDDAGTVLPDEAYTLRIQLTSGSFTETYDPAKGFKPVIQDPLERTYSAREGVLTYVLSRPSRVHIQAGEVKLNPKTGHRQGPVLKTVLDQAPRIAGRIVERWDGLDASRTVAIPELPGFVTSVFAASLAENSIIATGNTKLTFLAYARAHRPAAAIKPRRLRQGGHQMHHVGLTVFEDVSPVISLSTVGARGQRGMSPATLSLPLELEAVVPEDARPHFLSQPTTAYVYVDDKMVKSYESPGSPLRISLGRDELPPGEHRVAINWDTHRGPVGINALKVAVPNDSTPEATR